MRDAFALSIGMRRLQGGASAFDPSTLNAEAYVDLLTTPLFRERLSQTTSAGVGDVVGSWVNPGTLGGIFKALNDANRPTLVELSGKRMLYWGNGIAGEISLDNTTTLRRGIHHVTTMYFDQTAANFEDIITLRAGGNDYMRFRFDEANERGQVTSNGLSATGAPTAKSVTSASSSFSVSTLNTVSCDMDDTNLELFYDNVSQGTIAHGWGSGDTVAGAVCILNDGLADNLWMGNTAWLPASQPAADRQSLHDWSRA